ncbi:MAG: hypothetical protein QY322_04860 [bacterium]|nr:MAG: hypothetical protein QY322_04860 [bacterium]
MTTPKNMTNDQLFRALVNSQSAMKAELLGVISKLSQETEKGFKKVNEKIDKVDTNLTTRINYLGKQLNTLDEDAPQVVTLKIWRKGWVD